MNPIAALLILGYLAWALCDKVKPEKNETITDIADPSYDIWNDDELPDSEGLPGTKIQNN